MNEDIVRNTSIICCIERGMNEDGISFWKCKKTIGHEEITIRHLNQKASSFAVFFNDYQHVDEILPDRNNYPEKTGNLVVNNLILLLPEFYTFDSVHSRMDPERISVNKASFDNFLHIVSLFQNPTELTEEVRRQARAAAGGRRTEGCLRSETQGCTAQATGCVSCAGRSEADL